MSYPAPARLAELRERDDAIAALAIAGDPPLAIADKLLAGNRNLAAQRMHKARRRGEAVPYFDSKGRVVADATGKPTGDIYFTLRRADIDRVEAAARERGVSPGKLAHEIVRRVLRHDLLAAVLDP